MTTIGVVGQTWRATVSEWGAVQPWDGGRFLDWWVAADDRWHTPRTEPTLRQHHLRGAPVIETVIRVPGGDAIHRVYSVAEQEGLTVLEVENASSLPFAVAFGRPDLLTTRPPSNVPVQGIELPPRTIVLPVAHRTTLRVALPHHRGRAPGPLPAALPDADAVARGWVTQTERGMVLDQPDGRLMDAVVGARAELLLNGPGEFNRDPIGAVLAAGELLRLGEPPGLLMGGIARALERVARSVHGEVAWDVAAAFDAGAGVLRSAGEHRAAQDALDVGSRLGPPGRLPTLAPDGPGRLVTWATRRLVLPTLAGADLLAGYDAAWQGSSISAFRVPVRGVPVSFAVRWHGDRPALLWECGSAMALRASAVDPTWSTTEAQGEALLAPPLAGRSERRPEGAGASGIPGPP